MRGSDVNTLGNFESTESLGITMINIGHVTAQRNREGKDKKERICLKSWGTLGALQDCEPQ